MKADLDHINHWKYGSLKATRQFVKVQRYFSFALSPFGYFFLVLFWFLSVIRNSFFGCFSSSILGMAGGLSLSNKFLHFVFGLKTEFWFEESCWQPAVHPFSFGKSFFFSFEFCFPFSFFVFGLSLLLGSSTAATQEAS